MGNIFVKESIRSGLAATGRAIVIAAVVAPNAWATAACNKGQLDPPGPPDPAPQVVLDLTGQTGFQCSNLQGIPSPENPTGRMSSVEVEAYQVSGNQNGFNVQGSTPGLAFDAVFARSRDGKQCLYYLDNTNTVTNLTTGGKPLQTVTVCSDGIGVPVADDEPVSTSRDCTVDPDSAALQNAIDDNSRYDIVLGIGRGADDSDNLAVCSDTQLGTGVQQECVGEPYCPAPIGNASYPIVPDRTSNPNCVPNQSGEIPLECRHCEISAVLPADPGNLETPYCWELSHSVDLDAGTFKPLRESEKYRFEIDSYEGSKCYKVNTTYKGRSYSYWTPSGCP
jgi:hypothetical protein